MRAVVITGRGGSEVLDVRDVEKPVPQGAEVRVRVRACGLNRADLMQTRGLYPAPPGVPADIPGLEYAREIDALGPGVTGPLEVGDRVFGIEAGGAELSTWSPTSGWPCRSPRTSISSRPRPCPRCSSRPTTPCSPRAGSGRASAS
ncbi:MAG: alcohol dehydrogenase catalytic domain-containing protein [Isosphaeraceae bacterium]